MFVKMTVEDRVAVVTIDHPPVNVLDTETFAELGEVVEEIAGNKEVRAVVITGAGQAFVAGADIKQLASLQSPEQAQQLLGDAHAFFDRVDNLPVPVIAAGNGSASAGETSWRWPATSGSQAIGRGSASPRSISASSLALEARCG